MSNKAKPRNKEIKHILVKCAENSTMHALPNILYNDSIVIKLVWIVSLAICASLAGFLVYMSITDYLSFEVVTKSFVSHESPTDFPTITICNLNPYNTNRSIEFIKSIYEKNKIDDLDKIENLMGQPTHHKILFIRSIIETNVIKLNLTDAEKNVRLFA